MCYPEGISGSKQADDLCKIHFRHGRDPQRFLVTLSTWWCGCISIVRKIMFATSWVCKGPPSRTNSNLQCPPNPVSPPSSRWNQRGLHTWKHFGHRWIAKQEWRLGESN
jgi:hypothetical protein